MLVGARGRSALICALLAAATLFVYAQVAGFDFVGLDDHSYVSENPRVLAGLTSSSLAWAWTATTETHWAPLTWMSFMLDAQMGGPGPRLFHLTNLALHLINAWLLFYVLARITGFAWRSALVALLFAVHPLHVESVAWVTERKDVLSGLFWFLALLAYARYTEKPGPLRYALVAVVYVLGLLSKSMMVTLPLVLLILDGWPLRRFQTPGPELAAVAPRVATPSSRKARRGTATPAQDRAAPQAPADRHAWSWRRLAIEKIPLAVLAIPVSWMAWQGQASSGTLGSFEQFPASVRAANAFVSSGTYLAQTIWPVGLAVPYPYWPESLTFLKVAAAVGVFVALCAAALLTARRRPSLLAGWLWYVVTLLPVSGLVQAGAQSRADRYTYLPLIGIFIMVVWGAAEALAMFARQPRVRALTAAAAVVMVVALSVAARVQASHWRSSETLFTRALAVTDRNAIAQNGLGLDQFEKGHPGDALVHYETALTYWPSYAEAHVNAAAALDQLGRFPEAVAHYDAAVHLRPRDPRIVSHLGYALLETGATDRGIDRLFEASRMAPGDPELDERLGAALAHAGRREEALEPLRAAARERPGDPQARVNLGLDLAALGRLEEAREALLDALRLAPDSAAAHKNLGVVLARMGRLDEAAQRFEAAARLDPSDQGARRNLERVRAMLEIHGSREGAGH